MMTSPITVIEGGQWGSEAKGAIAGEMCRRRDIHYAVRTGAINAGHTVYYNGVPYAMQQIPTGWVNPGTKLVLGAGTYIHPPTLMREIEAINAAMPESNVLDRLFIDYRCGVHDEGAELASKAANRHHSIGATGKGCSEAIVAKIRNRNAGYQLFHQTTQGQHPMLREYVDTCALLNKAYDKGERILLEGTQGTHLDLHLGPYPYTTSRMTSAANWVAECGLSPALHYEVVLVCRTYPIRVAGNSGPMPQETDWVWLARDINSKRLNMGMPLLVSEFALTHFEAKMEYAAAEAESDGRYRTPKQGHIYNLNLGSWTDAERNTYRVAASELHRDAIKLCDTQTVRELQKLFEMTTVTKKLRRIAKFDIGMVQDAIAINRPSYIVLTFLDYVVPELAGADIDTIGNDQYASGRTKANFYTAGLEEHLKVPIRYVSVGPKPGQMIDTRTVAQL